MAVSAVLAGGVAPAAAATSGPPYSQCPSIGASPSCQLLVVVNADRTVSVVGDPAIRPFDGSDDTLVGVVNHSAAPVSAITVTGPGTGLGNLDGDGLCTFGVAGCPFGTTSYEGPGTSIVLAAALPDSAEIDFAGGLAAGASTYFSLEGALTSAKLTARQGPIIPKLTLAIKVVDQPLDPDPGTNAYVRLEVAVTNADGTPAVGAHIALSFSAAKTFVTNSAGRFQLLLPVSLLRTDVTVTATTAAASVTQSTALYNVTEQLSCNFAGVPASSLDELGEYLDFLVPSGSVAPLGKVVETVVKYLSGAQQVGGLASKIQESASTLTTQTKGYVLTGPNLSPLYVLTLEVTDAATGAVHQEYLTSYSRSPSMITNVADGGTGGLPLDRIVRKLQCSSGLA
jgi:hypothetical protein